MIPFCDVRRTLIKFMALDNVSRTKHDRLQQVHGATCKKGGAVSAKIDFDNFINEQVGAPILCLGLSLQG